jgi:methyl-accepting chemotaxis protein
MAFNPFDADSAGTRRVKLRTFVLVAVPLALPIFFDLVVAPRRHEAALLEQSKVKAAAVTQLLAENAAAPMLFDDVKALEALVQTAKADLDLAYVTVVSDKNSQVMAEYASRGRRNVAVKEQAPAGSPTVWMENDGVHAALRITKGNQQLGTLQAGFFTDGIRQKASDFRFITMILALVVIAIAAVMALLLGKSFAELFERMRMSMLQTVKRVDDLVNQLAAVTAEQTSAASEESTALHESNSTAADVGQAASSAAARASALIEGGARAEEGAASGLESVGSAIQAMRQVREQMNTIGNTIGALSERAATIGEIASTVALLAERSNLLALNAAIEAARAGAQGRGFAVVAQEMRSLADGSNRSAGQVKSIIAEIQAAITRAVGDAREGERRVQHAESLADRAGENMRSFAEVTREFAKLGKEIAASANQQSTAIEQMVESIGHATQAGTTQLETTKQVEETARQLRQLSKEMLDVVGGRIGNGASGSNGLLTSV